MTIQVRINGIDALKGELLAIPKTLETSVLRQMSQIAYDSAQKGAGAHSKTGALFQSLYNRAIPKGREVGHDPDRTRTDWGGGMSYSVFVNFGTRPHKIRPKNKKALRWAGPGGFSFAKEVNHPGYRGDPYMARAADEAIRAFSQIVDNAIKEAK
jgi:hypothetical protein